MQKPKYDVGSRVRIWHEGKSVEFEVIDVDKYEVGGPVYTLQTTDGRAESKEMRESDIDRLKFDRHDI